MLSFTWAKLELNPTGLQPQQHVGNSCRRSGFLAAPSVGQKSFFGILLLFFFLSLSLFLLWYKDKTPSVVYCSIDSFSSVAVPWHPAYCCICRSLWIAGWGICGFKWKNCASSSALLCLRYLSHFHLLSHPLFILPEGAFRVVNYLWEISRKHYWV